MRTPLTLLALAVVAVPAWAQDSTAADSRWVQTILNLPKTVEEGRQTGVSQGSIQAVLDSLRRRRVPAEDAQQILQDEFDAVRGGAPKENFGATVNALLARGLTGRELADAIHAEHARRGIGQGRGKAGDQGRDQGRGQGKGKGRKP